MTVEKKTTTRKNTKNKSKIKKPKIEKMTVSEFKKVLEGIEMFQEDDWVPNQEQWSIIREMIENLQETIVEVYEEAAPNFTINNSGAPGMPTSPPSVPLHANGIPESSLSNISIPTPTLTEKDIVQSGNPAIKTKNIMGEPAEDGTYNSSFA